MTTGEGFTDTEMAKRAPRCLRILLVTSDKFPPFRPAAKAIFGEEFSRRSHQVDWLMPAEEGSDPRRAVPFGNGIAYLASRNAGTTRLHRLVKYVRDFFNDFRVFSLARRNSYDVIQAKDKYVAGVMALIAAKMTGTRFCFWLAYPHPESNLYNARQRIARYPFLYWLRGHYQSFILYRILLPNADHTFVQSEQMKLDIAGKGFDPRVMTPVPSSLNLDSVPYRGDDDPGPKGRNVLYVGTLLRKRRLDFVVRAFAKVRANVPDARLVFVGAGENPEDERMLESEIDRCGIDRSAVRFVGRVLAQDVWRYIEEAAVCLSPYYPTFVLNSTSPTKLIEYMAMSRPTVANEHPEQSLVLDHSGAGLCVPWDEEAFARAIEKLLRDRELATSMGRAGRAWVERYRSNERMADLVEAKYIELTRGNRPDAATAADTSRRSA